MAQEEPAGSSPGEAWPDAAEEPTGASDAGTVTDRYVARRLARGAAERAELERREAEEAGLTGEAPPQGAFAFYLILGIVISILLLVVISRTAYDSSPAAAPPTGGAITAPQPGQTR